MVELDVPTGKLRRARFDPIFEFDDDCASKCKDSGSVGPLFEPQWLWMWPSAAYDDFGTPSKELGENQPRSRLFRVHRVGKLATAEIATGGSLTKELADCWSEGPMKGYSSTVSAELKEAIDELRGCCGDTHDVVWLVGEDETQHNIIFANPRVVTVDQDTAVTGWLGLLKLLIFRAVHKAHKVCATAVWHLFTVVTLLFPFPWSLPFIPGFLIRWADGRHARNELTFIQSKTKKQDTGTSPGAASYLGNYMAIVCLHAYASSTARLLTAFGFVHNASYIILVSRAASGTSFAAEATSATGGGTSTTFNHDWSLHAMYANLFRWGAAADWEALLAGWALSMAVLFAINAMLSGTTSPGWRRRSARAAFNQKLLGYLFLDQETLKLSDDAAAVLAEASRDEMRTEGAAFTWSYATLSTVGGLLLYEMKKFFFKGMTKKHEVTCVVDHDVSDILSEVVQLTANFSTPWLASFVEQTGLHVLSVEAGSGGADADAGHVCEFQTTQGNCCYIDEAAGHFSSAVAALTQAWVLSLSAYAIISIFAKMMLTSGIHRIRQINKYAKHNPAATAVSMTQTL